MATATNVVGYVGERIRQLRTEYDHGKGLSQDALAKEVKVTANTVSRWETATYKPDLEDLERLARFFGVSILHFFPNEEPARDEQMKALLRTAKDLPKGEIEELRRYVEFRKARFLYTSGSRPRPGRRAKRSA